MSFAGLCFFYIFIALAESSPLVAFLVPKFALPYNLSPLNFVAILRPFFSGTERMRC